MRPQPEVQRLQVGGDRWRKVSGVGPCVPDQAVPHPCEAGRAVPLAAAVEEPDLALRNQVRHAFHGEGPPIELAEQHYGAGTDRARVEMRCRRSVAVQLEGGPGERGLVLPQG